jgi:hypothetical protein
MVPAAEKADELSHHDQGNPELFRLDRVHPASDQRKASDAFHVVTTRETSLCPRTRPIRPKKQKPAAGFAGRQHGSRVAYSGATPILRKTHE